MLWALFLAVPILASLLVAFTDFGLSDLRDPLGVEWAGLANFTAALTDQTVRRAALNTIYFVAVGVPASVGFGLLVAVLIQHGIQRFRAVFRVGYYLPVVTSIVALAVVWRFMLNPDIGLINRVLEFVGLPGRNWLRNPATAMPSIIVMAVWRNLGQSMVIFLAGLSAIDPTLYEAAEVDGAGPLQRFRHITVPQLRPVILFSLVITSIGFLQVFEEPFVMTQGGPLGTTETVAIRIYEEGFNFFNLGYASAIAYLLFLAIAGLAFAQFRMVGADD